MNVKMNGKKIASATLHKSNGDTVIIPGEGYSLVLSATYHGDRDEFWVLLLKGEDEVARYNCRDVSEIVWK